VDETTNSTQFRPSNVMLQNFTTYRWRVRARNEVGVGPWSEVRSFTTIQEGAVLIIPETDLGRAVVRRQRVGTVTIQNILAQPVTIDAAVMTGRDASSFALRTMLTGAVIQAGESLQADIVFSPQSVGPKQAELLLSVSSGGATKEQRGLVRGTASLLDVNDVRFDTVVAGFARLRNVALLNLDNRPTTVRRVIVGDENIFQLDAPTLPPYTVRAGDTLSLPIRCFTERTGTARTMITIVTDAGDSLQVQAEAFVREPRDNDVRTQFALRALDNNMAAGGTVRLELYIPSGNGRDVFRADNPSYRAELRFNRNVLVPAGNEQRLRPVGNDEFQQYSIAQTQWQQNPADANSIAVFSCVAVSGNIDSTQLFIRSIQWGTDKINITTLTSGTFRTNLCKAGGLRLTTTAKANKIAAIRPNPAKDVAEITYSVREDGNVEILLLSAAGKQVAQLVHGDHAPGEYSLSVPTSEIPSGVYFVVMQTPSGRVQERLRVVR
jgi:hypothetical protein